jgi:flagellar biosynthesis protein FlhF
MNVRKFYARTSREALRKVRDVLGPNAVILSNRSVEGGVEILALSADEASSMAAAAGDVGGAPPLIPQPVGDIIAKPVPPEPLSTVCGVHRFDDSSRACPPEFAVLKSEIQSLRSTLEARLAEISWGSLQKREPIRAALLREMLNTGFSPSLSRHVVENLPDDQVKQGAQDWVRSVLARNLNSHGSAIDVLEQGGIYALVGPTGVGKTTTAAKLASRCVIRHGANSLALVTADGYRIGAQEQLRIYGKILGVMVHSVEDQTDLRIALAELKNKHTVLIDTAGVGQRDQMVADQAAMLSGADANVKRILCLSATSTGETLSEVIKAYEGNGLAGSIITKLDEAATIGSVLDAVIRHKMGLFYVANGQRVPEDIHLPNSEHLVDMAFKLRRKPAPFQMHEDELPLIMASAGGFRASYSPKGMALG